MADPFDELEHTSRTSSGSSTSGRRQLDRKRQAIEAAADLGHGGRVLVGDGKMGLDRCRSLDEQRDRLVPGKHSERREVPHTYG